MKIKTKPIKLEAIRWTGSNLFDIQEFLNIAFEVGEKKQIKIPYKNNIKLIVNPNDWIILNRNNEYYPCPAHLFDQLYEVLK